ncbi:MAG: hypothetical protein GX043_12570 [Desulfovibrionales bacterium]|nr:hypothetical protein [Desulfovibrionales bacterium]
MTLDDINLQLVKMPCNIEAAVTTNNDGSYTVFVNKNISVEQQKEAILHELRHIERGDFLCNEGADEIEYQVRKEK